MHLFLLSINNSGSSILYEKIRQSKYTTTLPDEGQFIRGFSGPNPFVLNCPYMFSERYHDFSLEKNYDWFSIKTLWNSFWEEDLIKVEKSPPNVVRAHMLKRHFENSEFIIQVRNPYQIVTSILKLRPDISIERSCAHVASCFFEQYKNYFSYTDRVVKYEDMIYDKNKINNIFKDLGIKDFDLNSESNPVKHYKENKITNFDKKIPDDVFKIGKEIFQAVKSEINFFGYDL
jgi:hypothetical protein